MFKLNSLIMLAALGFSAVFAVQQAPSSKDPASAAKPQAALPTNLFLDKEPPGSKSVEDTKASAKTGDKVTIRGRIGGSGSPFVEGRAVFTLVGSGIKACSDNPGDKCKTPWDYCCETPESIAKHSAMIQVVDSAGNPVRANLKGVNGLNELSEVIIEGSVKESKEKIMIISATGIYVVKT